LFFSSNFKYSLTQKIKDGRKSWLEYFLTESKKGHCEYFATAATLLFREAGIPARYVTGFFMHEYSRLEKKFLVRERDGHAWCEIWNNNKWEIVETTPAEWIEEDTENASFLEPLGDFFRFLNYRWSLIKMGKDENTNYYLIIIIGVLSTFLLAKIYARKKRSVDSVFTGKRRGFIAESPLFKIEKQLNSLGFSREAGERLESWFKRLDLEKKSSLSGLIYSESICEMIKIHNKIRFDAENASKEELMKLEKMVDEWLEEKRVKRKENITQR